MPFQPETKRNIINFDIALMSTGVPNLIVRSGENYQILRQFQALDIWEIYDFDWYSLACT